MRKSVILVMCAVMALLLVASLATAYPVEGGTVGGNYSDQQNASDSDGYVPATSDTRNPQQANAQATATAKANVTINNHPTRTIYRTKVVRGSNGRVRTVVKKFYVQPTPVNPVVVNNFVTPPAQLANRPATAGEERNSMLGYICLGLLILGAVVVALFGILGSNGVKTQEQITKQGSNNNLGQAITNQGVVTGGLAAGTLPAGPNQTVVTSVHANPNGGGSAIQVVRNAAPAPAAPAAPAPAPTPVVYAPPQFGGMVPAAILTLEGLVQVMKQPTQSVTFTPPANQQTGGNKPPSGTPPPASGTKPPATGGNPPASGTKPPPAAGTPPTGGTPPAAGAAKQQTGGTAVATKQTP